MVAVHCSLCVSEAVHRRLFGRWVIHLLRIAQLTLSDLKLDYEYPPKPLHRLDYQTSGCLLLGRTDRAAKQFSSALANNKVSKEYWALVENIHKVHNDRGVINEPISLSSSGRPYVGGDRAASTQWEILRHNVGVIRYLQYIFSIPTRLIQALDCASSN